MSIRPAFRVAATVFLVVAVVPTRAISQAGVAGGKPLSPPAACIKASSDWRTAQSAPALDAYRKATDSTRAGLMAKAQAAMNEAAAGAQKMAAECATRFTVEDVPPDQLMDLVNLYTLARDTSGARRATERLTTSRDLPPRARAQGLILQMQQEASRDPNFFGVITAAERIVAQIDALPDSLDELKLQAHRSMLGRYEYLDVAEGLYTHATAVIALAKKLNRKQEMIDGYRSLARSFADRLDPDSALRILNAGEKLIGDSATERFKDFRNRYALIGTQAAAITAAWWINPDAEGVIAPVAGKVNLIEFTAHWCGPCKNSYPGLRSLTERLKGKPFTGFMVTQLYGYLGTRKGLTPEQEVEADREYFGREHALPFAVAINPQSTMTQGKYRRPQPDEDYRVGGIPQIIIVDKKGVIRQIVTGWDQGNTERFARLIDQLISEK